MSAEDLLFLIRQEAIRIADTLIAARETQQSFPETIRLDPEDLGRIVTAVTALKPGAGADDIAQAIKQVVAPPSNSGTEIADALEKVAKGLERQSQVIGGVSRSFGSAGLRTLTASDQVTVANLTGLSTEGSTTAILSSVPSSGSSVALLTASTSRRGATIYNDSTASLYVAFGVAASTTVFTVKMATNSYFEFPLPVYRGVVNGLWDAVNGSARLTELT